MNLSVQSMTRLYQKGMPFAFSVHGDIHGNGSHLERQMNYKPSDSYYYKMHALYSAIFCKIMFDLMDLDNLD